MFGIQAIPDACDTKYCILKLMTPCWPQELPVEHTEAVKIHEIT